MKKIKIVDIFENKVEIIPQTTGHLGLFVRNEKFGTHNNFFLSPTSAKILANAIKKHFGLKKVV